MKIVCYSPHSAIWHYGLSDATISHALKKKGHEVIYITSGTEFLNCDVCIRGNGLNAGSSHQEKSYLNRLGLVNERILKEEFGLNGYDIGQVLLDDDKEKIDLLIKKLNKDNFADFVYDGVALGKISLYEHLLINKKMDSKITEDEWPHFKQVLRNTITSYIASKKILKKEKPDAILMYGDLYSVNQAWVRCAKSMNVSTYFIDIGLNFSDVNNTLIIAKCSSIDYYSELKRIWLKVKNIPVSKKMLSYVTDHFLALLKAKYFLIYSSPKSGQFVDIRKHFGIKSNQNILTATMSSHDELFAAEYIGVWRIPKHLIFSSQIDWIKGLIEYVKKRKDLFLLIRVHPREFPNKRDGLKSEHAYKLEKCFKNLPVNVKVNWPTDNISIFDLAQATNIFLNAWSTVGVEMSLLGIPVVSYSKDLMLYPSDLNLLGKNLQDYFSKINQALKRGWDYERIVKTYRWLALYYCRTIVRLRKRRINLGQIEDNKNIFSIDYVYNKIPEIVRIPIKKTLYPLMQIKINRAKRAECRTRIAEKIDVSKVEKMIIGPEKTLANINDFILERTDVQHEDINIKNELRRIYKELFAWEPGNLVDKNNLKNNFDKLFGDNQE